MTLTNILYSHLTQITEMESKGLIKQTYYHRGMPIYTNTKAEE
jgi:hypothetical protein